MRRKLILLPFFLWSLLAFYSSRIQIIHADLNQGRNINGEQLRILKGSVHVVNDTVHMYCDSAVFYEKINMLHLSGNVILDNGQRLLRAKQISYYPGLDKAICKENVRISGKKDSLFADKLTLLLANSSGTAKGNVYLKDKVQNAIIRGNQARYDKLSKNFECWGNARFFKQDSADSDPLTVTAENIRYFGGADARAVAIDSVVIKQGSFRSLSDSATYLTQKEQADLKGHPMAWVEKSTLQGQRILADFDSSRIKHIYIQTDARAVSLVDSIKKTYNVLQGKIIEFFLTYGKADSIISRNNASSIYYLDKEGGQQGSNYSTSDSIFVYFKNGKPDSIEIVGGAQGTFYPEGYKGEKK